jgi:restriction system protein
MVMSSDIPDYQSLMLPVLRAAQTGEVRIGSVVEQLADELGLNGEQRAKLLPSGKQTIFANRVHWARTYLAKAGLLEATRRAHFRLTERGREVLAQTPTSVTNSFLNQYEEFRQFRTRGREDGDGTAPALALGASNESRTPDEVMRAAHAELERALTAELLERILVAPPEFFERLVIALLLAMGYGGSATTAGRAIGRSGDDGVDGVIDQDALGLDRVYVQAKRYARTHTVGASAIRDFFGSLDRHKANKGLFVTTSTFSPSARKTAELLSKRIVLVDGVQLAELMIKHGVGCRKEEALYIGQVDENFFD